MTQQHTKKETIVYGSLLLLQTFFWGLGNPVIKIGLTTIPPFYCTAFRFTLALIIFMLFFGKKISAQITRDNLKECIIIGAFTAASFLLSTACFLYTTATTAGFLIAFPVVFTPILSIFLLNTRMTKSLAFVILLVLAGMYCLCGNDGTFRFGLGELMALLSAVAGAGMLIYSSKHVREIGPLALSASQCAVSAVISFVCAFLFEDFHDLAQTSPMGWGCVVYLAVCCTCIAYMLQNISLKHVSATFVSLILCAEPIFTAIDSYFLLHEVLSFSGFVGAVLITVGICIASVLTPQERKHGKKQIEEKKENAEAAEKIESRPPA